MGGKFQNAVKEIGRVVVILHPWENPIPFTRAWCLWEIYRAISLLEEDKLQIVMSSTTEKAFVNGLTKKPSEYLQLLANIDVEKSKAFVAADKDRIFAEVRAMDGGFHKVNALICSKMRTLVVKVFKDAIDSETKLTKTLVDKKRAYGDILTKQQDLDNALLVFKECLRQYKSLNGGYNFFCCVLFGETNKDVANTHADMGMVYDSQSKYFNL